ncbi:MAG: hypothetical protein Kapaf2KO_14640 [Candidatus Kapaibacteriales bacterium]
MPQLFWNMNSSFRLFITSLLITLFLLSSVLDAESRRRRKYYPDVTRAKATELMQSSREICNIMGLEFKPIDTDLADQLENDSEDSLEADGTVSSNSLEISGEDNSEGTPVYREGSYTDQDIFIYVDNHIDELDNGQLQQLWTAYITESDIPDMTESGIEKRAIADAFMYWLGTPYRFGGLTEKGIDCSAFVREVFRNSGELELPRTAVMQYGVGAEVEREDLEFGDMVFFKTSRYARITHVGIYLADDLFVHASSRQGVTVSSLNSSYYKRTYRGARRLTIRDLDELTFTSNEDPYQYDFE